MREFAKHGAVVFGGLLASNALIYVAYALTARSLGVGEAGLFMALLSASQLLAIPASAFGTVITKLSSDAAVAGRLGKLRFLSDRIAFWALPLALVILLIAIAGNGALSAFFHVSDLLVIPGAALMFASYLPLIPQRAIFNGASHFRSFVGSWLVEAVCKALTGLLLVFLGGGIRVALAGFILATTASYLFNVVIGRRLSTSSEPMMLPTLELRRHVTGTALPVFGLNAITFSDSILARHLFDPITAGLYSTAALAGRAIVTVTQFAPIVLMPKAIASVASGRSPVRYLLAAIGAALAVVTPILTLVVFAPHVITRSIGGGAFDAAASYMLPYGLAMSALALATILATYLIGIGKRAFAAPVAFVCAAEIGAMFIVPAQVANFLWIVGIGDSLLLLITVLTVILTTLDRQQGGMSSEKAISK